MGKSTWLTPFIYFTIFVVSAGQQFLSDPYLHVKLHSGTKLQIQNWFNWSWSHSSREMWCHVISLHGAANLIELSAETYEPYLSMPKISTKGWICQFKRKITEICVVSFLWVTPFCNICLACLLLQDKHWENGWKNSPTNYEHLWVYYVSLVHPKS